MKKAFITVDLLYGDSGKGKVVSYLTDKHDSKLTVRYTGGAQSSHAVVTDDGIVHRFSQFGSGSFNKGTKTLYSKYCYFNPIICKAEADELIKLGQTDILERFYVDENALVTLPYHRATNRLLELARGNGKHGSCGMGIGETARIALVEPTIAPRVKDFFVGNVYLREMLDDLRISLWEYVKPQVNNKVDKNDPLVQEELKLFDTDPHKIIEWMNKFMPQINVVNQQQVTELFNSTETVVFEGAQGVLIDQDFGFHPYTTWSDTTSRNAYKILADIESIEEPTEIGILRAYSTRHGVGPFPSYSEKLTKKLIDPNNPVNYWQENLRIGHFDRLAVEYALKVNGPVDSLAVTYMDVATKDKAWTPVTRYDLGDDDMISIPHRKHPNLLRQEILTNKLLKATAKVEQPYFEVVRWITSNFDTEVKYLGQGPKINQMTEA